MALQLTTAVGEGLLISGVQGSYDMRASTVTIRLDKEFHDVLTRASPRFGRNGTENAREALCRELRVCQCEAIRQMMMPLDEARGI